MRNSDKFLWGAATSAYQVEGGNKNDWSETVFDAGQATGHYYHFEEDFGLAKSLGHNAQRISIEWSRIEPEKGKFNQEELEHYYKVISAIREKGMEPMVTLWHFTNPIWFARLGGFTNKKAEKYFSRYVNFVVGNLKNSVKFWITINEPMIYAANAYYKGIWPTQEFSPIFSYFKAINNLIKCHRTAYKIIHRHNHSAQVGIAKNNIHFGDHGYPWRLLKKIAEYWWNSYFLNKISRQQDFIGLNYYFHKHIGEIFFGKKEPHPVSDIGWGIYPKGLYHILKDLKNYKKPIYITENGLADAKDQKREQFIKDHVYWMKKAMNHGVDVRGYFHWSLIDNFEWDKGFGPRFGLIEVDYRTMERKIRPSAYAYKNIIKDNS